MKFGISIKLNDLWVSVESHFKVLEFYIYYKDGKKYWEPFDGRNAVSQIGSLLDNQIKVYRDSINTDRDYVLVYNGAIKMKKNEVESEIDLLLDETISSLNDDTIVTKKRQYVGHIEG